MEIIDVNQMIKGTVRVADVVPGGVTKSNNIVLPGDWRYREGVHDNLILHTGYHTLVQLLRNEPDGKAYHMAAMYFEFDNSGGAVTPPTPAVADTLSYYDNLNTSNPNQDYLRVPLINTDSENSDVGTFAQDNVGVFHAQTEGTTGIHGLTFGTSSKVYGGALVAIRDSGDAAQDIIFSRLYLSSPNQIDKAAGSQIGFTWKLTFS